MGGSKHLITFPKTLFMLSVWWFISLSYVIFFYSSGNSALVETPSHLSTSLQLFPSPVYLYFDLDHLLSSFHMLEVKQV